VKVAVVDKAVDNSADKRGVVVDKAVGKAGDNSVDKVGDKV